MMREIFAPDHRSSMPSLNGLRALSILWVIIYHSYFFSQYAFAEIHDFIQYSLDIPWYFTWIKRGDFGVDCFFVLSAFLIGTQLFNEHNKTGAVRLSTFYVKRLCRIYPLYLLALAITVIDKGWQANIFYNLFAINNVIDLKNIVIPWSWSIAVEIQFYLLAPLAVLYLSKQQKLWLVLIIALLLAPLWNAWFYFTNATLQTLTVMDIIATGDTDALMHYMQFLYVLPTSRLTAFVVGLFAAWVWVYKKPSVVNFFANKLTYNALLWLALTTVLFSVLQDMYMPGASMSAWQWWLYKFSMVSGRAVFSIAIGVLLIIGLLDNTIVNKFLSLHGFYGVARVSYSMYLFHPPFLFLSFYLLIDQQPLTEYGLIETLQVASLGIVLAFMFGILTYYLVERWFIGPRLRRIVKWR